MFTGDADIFPRPPANLYGIRRWPGFENVHIISRVIRPARFTWLKRLHCAIQAGFFEIDFAAGYSAAAGKPTSGNRSR